VLFIVLPGNEEIVSATLHYVIQHVVRHDRWGLGASYHGHRFGEKVKAKFSQTRYQALGSELIPVYS